MVDTVRTLAALQTLLADNTSGDIDPQDLRDFLVSAYPVRATVVRRAANQALSSGVSADISWDTEYVDDMGIISVPQTQVTPNVAGWYGVSVSLDFNNTTGVRFVHMKLNDTFDPPYISSANVNLGDWRITMSSYFPFNGTTDFLVVECFATVTGVEVEEALLRMVYLGPFTP